MKAQPPRIWSDMPGSPIRKSCKAVRSDPVIAHSHFTATGTRFLEANGRKAIADLYSRSFSR